MAKRSPIRKIWNIFTSIIVIIAVVLAIALVGVRLIGLQVYTVVSGSMEPNIHVGSLVYVKQVDRTELGVDDPITFSVGEGTIVTHRIVEVLVDENDPSKVSYVTKGDANDTEDAGTIGYDKVIGKVVFSVPYLGYVSNYIQQPPGMYVAIACAAVFLILLFIPDLFSDNKKKDE